MKKLAFLASVGVLMASAHAVNINFEEFAADNSSDAMPSDRYVYLGVTFLSSDEGMTWGGNSAGDPGGWGLEGTNGAQFAGFNGDSRSLWMSFVPVVQGFSLDASRSAGSEAGDSMTIEGWFNGSIVDSDTVVFSDINVWSTLSISGTFEEVHIFGNGVNHNPFGIDNVNWNVVPEPASMAALGLGAAAMLRRRRN